MLRPICKPRYKFWRSSEKNQRGRYQDPVSSEYYWQGSSYGSVPVDFLRPKFWVAHTKDDVISILMHKYTYTNMYIIKKIISCRFILCWDITSLFKPYEKSCRRRKVKIEKILTVTYRTLLTKTTNFLKSGGYKNMSISKVHFLFHII